MNLEELKQFIKQVGWGMLATTDGRISCSTSVPVRVNVVVPHAGPVLSAVERAGTVSIPVRVYEILAGKTKIIYPLLPV